jgi:hypothetical protein
MSSSTKVLSAIAIVGALLPGSTNGAELSLVPVSATGPHTITGNDISLDAGGQVVSLELRLRDWDPDGDGGPRVSSWLALVDPSDFESGEHGVLSPILRDCESDADCQAAVHPLSLCASASYLGVPLCHPGFFDTSRTDYVFSGLEALTVFDVSSPGFRFAAVTISVAATDPGFTVYGATLLVEVPSDAQGTFTIELIPSAAGGSNITDENRDPITGLSLVSATITLPTFDCESLNNCSGHGYCPADGVCACDEGWAGVDCSTPTCEAVNDCSGHGTCVFANTCSCNSGWTGSDCSVPPPPTIALVPVSADGLHVINGNEISVQAGRRVFLEFKLSNWDPDGDGTPALRAWVAKLDASGYSTGLQGTLTPFAPACTTDAQCQASVDPLSECLPGHAQCTPVFFDTSRSDYVFSGLLDIQGVDFWELLDGDDFRTASTAISGVVPDPGSQVYGATLVLEVPSDAQGTFTVGFTPGFNPPAETSMIDETGQFILRLSVVPARITIAPSEDRFAPKNRYLTIDTSDLNQNESIRVTFRHLPQPFDVHNGLSMWVGEPREVSTNGHNVGPDIPGYPNFHVATLRCEPLSRDWSVFGIVEVYHKSIVPDGIYDVEVFDAAAPPNLVRSSTLVTARSGDAVGRFDGTWRFWTPPDGTVNITDAVAMLEAFISLPGAPHKTRVDVWPTIPDFRVNIVDVVLVIDAFRGIPFPFGPGSSPCAP